MRPDQVVGQRYRLDRELGTGGTATVWLATDVAADRAVAVKLLLPSGGPGATAHRERLRAEARTLSLLDHPHVVRVLDHGEHDGRDFIVMEYVQGGSLADHLAQRGPVAPAVAVALIGQLLDALGAAHAAGIVHRDVKPANVLLRSETQAALCDFGIARSEGANAATATGVALGSAGYMAPEQRIDARRVGPGADLYATACTLFHLVTQQTPVDLYLAPDHSPRWKDVPAPLQPILRRATQADPDARYLSADEMRSALAAVTPALEGLPAAPSSAPSAPHYVPTEVPGATATPALSVAAGASGRTVGPADWSRSGGRPPGRLALWVGVSMVFAITFAGLSLAPVLQRIEARSPSAPASEPLDAPLLPPPDLTGRWVGNLGGRRPMHLVLTGTTDAPEGELTLRLGNHELRSTVTGRWDAGALVLTEAGPRPRVLLADPGRDAGILTGELHGASDEGPLPFALVWVSEAQ